MAGKNTDDGVGSLVNICEDCFCSRYCECLRMLVRPTSIPNLCQLMELREVLSLAGLFAEGNENTEVRVLRFSSIPVARFSLRVSPISVILSGQIMEVRESHPENAPSPILFRLAGSSM